MPEPLKIYSCNLIGLLTLIRREIARFANVWLQTIVAPVVTTLLFYTVFALAFGGVARQVGGVAFLEFLAPGLVMMTELRPPENGEHFSEIQQQNRAVEDHSKSIRNPFWCQES